MTARSMERALHFKETRIQRHREIAEDYTEMIAELIQMHGKVRVCDLAKQMGISHVSVLKTIRKLIRDGYLIKDEGEMELTLKGSETAAYSKKKHTILSEFLRKLGVPEDIAAIDVEGIEHHVSPETLQALENHMKGK